MKIMIIIINMIVILCFFFLIWYFFILYMIKMFRIINIVSGMMIWMKYCIYVKMEVNFGLVYKFVRLRL